MTTPVLNLSGGLSLGGTIFSPSGPSATINLTGKLTATGEITGAGIPLSTHLHGGVTTGAGDTGVPIP
jgi:phage baseplate assembly protein gpV